MLNEKQRSEYGLQQAYLVSGRHPKQDWLLCMSDIIKDIDLSEIHDCEKCQGKIVSITVDLVGVERCGYCNEIVRYGHFIRQKMREAYGGIKDGETIKR